MPASAMPQEDDGLRRRAMRRCHAADADARPMRFILMPPPPVAGACADEFFAACASTCHAQARCTPSPATLMPPLPLRRRYDDFSRDAAAVAAMIDTFSPPDVIRSLMRAF